jgi:hypothetical protein
MNNKLLQQNNFRIFEKPNFSNLHIPIRTKVLRHPFDNNLFCADAEIIIKKGDGELDWFHGHSCNYDEIKALDIAKIESIERVLASKYFLKPYKKLYFYSITDSSKVEFDYSQKHILRITKEVGSTGLSIHNTKEHAVDHGIREIIERHILCEFWYKDRTLIKFKTEYFGSHFYIDYFTTHESTNFVLAILFERDTFVMFCGSSCKETLNASIFSARGEALLLSLQYISNKSNNNLVANKSDTLRRYQSLLVESNKFRINHVIIKTPNLNFKIDSNKKISNLELIQNLNLHTDSFSFSNINSIEDFHLYKVKSYECLTKEFCRIKYSTFLEDPFC